MSAARQAGRQTLGEEISNSVSHGIGSLLSVAGMTILIVLGASHQSLSAVLCAVFYGASLIILYTASTLYHSLTNATAKHIFQIFDHCSIFILISGTYTPISVLMIGGKAGWLLLMVNAACALLGIVLNAIDLKRWKKVSMLLYVVMGWMCLFTVRPLIQAAPSHLLWLLVAGGVAYTVGIIFYKAKKIKYMHFIWHLFVLAGSILQYYFVLLSCYA